jgi:hypothetical protein
MELATARFIRPARHLRLRRAAGRSLDTILNRFERFESEASNAAARFDILE